MINLIRRLARIREWIWSFRLVVVIIGLILAFVAGYFISIPKCRGMTREAATLIRKFETKEVNAILIVIIKSDGKQEFFYHDKRMGPDTKLESILEDSVNGK